MTNNGFNVCIIAYMDLDLPEYEVLNNVEVYRIIPQDFSRPRSLFGLRNNIAKSIVDKFNTRTFFCVDHRMLDLGCRIKKHIPEIHLIYDAHEYLQGYQSQFDETNSFLYKTKSKLFQLREKILEKKNLLNISLLCTISDSFADLYRKNFRFFAPTYTIRNVSEFFTSKTTFKETFPDEYIKLEKIKGKNNLIYFGDFFKYLNGIECLFEALKHIPEESSLILVGTNKNPEFFAKYFNHPDLKKRIVHIKRLPHPYLQFIAAYAVASSVPTMETEYLQTTFSLPNKLFDSIAANLPIICSDLAEHKKIIDRYNNGLQYSGSDWENAPKSIACAFEKMISNYAFFKNNALACSSLFSIEKEFSELMNYLKARVEK
jgi:glycosyltransferase involved in cell wall biosynthesis